MAKVKHITLFIIQILGLWLINQVGVFIAHYFNLPIPGNVLGMMLLFILLLLGIIKLEWVNEAASFLLKHLVFFFIPIAVGIMTFGTLFLKSGLSLMFILVLSAAIGMLTTGAVAQALTPKKEV